MFPILHTLAIFLCGLFKSRRRLEAENLFLRYQLNIALRQARRRVRLGCLDRILLVWMVRLWPNLLDAVQVVRPETVLRRHRAGFRAFWRWKSTTRAGRPKIDRDLRDLIQRMSQENPLWGAPRIHGELLMLGFAVAQSTVSKYMTRGRKPRSPSWKTGAPGEAGPPRKVLAKRAHCFIDLRHKFRRASGRLSHSRARELGAGIGDALGGHRGRAPFRDFLLKLVPVPSF